jgi:hypothetical protein
VGYNIVAIFFIVGQLSVNLFWLDFVDCKMKLPKIGGLQTLFELAQSWCYST